MRKPNKLYYIPWHWDYHGIGAFVVMTDTPENAKAMVKIKYEEMVSQYTDDDPQSWHDEPDYDKIKEIDNLFVVPGSNC